MMRALLVVLAKLTLQDRGSVPFRKVKRKKQAVVETAGRKANEKKPKILNIESDKTYGKTTEFASRKLIQR